MGLLADLGIIQKRKQETNAAIAMLNEMQGGTKPVQQQVIPAEAIGGLAAVQPPIQDVDGNWMQNFDDGKYVSYDQQGNYTVTGNNPKDFFGYDTAYGGPMQAGAGYGMKFQGQ